MTSEQNEVRGLRVVAFSVIPPAYQAIREWAAHYDHKLVLLITTPGPTTRRSTTYRDIVSMSPPEQDILITTRLKRTARFIKELSPDLILSFTFPYRIPPEVTSIPRFGAVNLHPAPLPLYRGPNPMRMIYDGHPTLGATLHRTEEDFDTGVIFSRHERPMPRDVTFENVFAVWRETMTRALDEGVRRAVAGEPGIPQDHSQASHAAQFTEQEHWLDWNLPVRLLQCRATALTFFDSARATIDGKPYTVQRVTPLPNVPAPAAPGTVLARADGAFILCAADGVVQVQVAEG
jgi:methionyl-tRNA formyltransferase